MPVSAAATLRIDLDAIAENYRFIRRQAGGAQVAGVVKADGYGLGAVQVTQALMGAGCSTFFVALFCEAMALKPALRVSDTLFILNGLHHGAEEACAQLGAVPVLNSLDQIERWGATARRLCRRLPAALQVDSGMSRLGLPPEEAEVLVSEPERLHGMDLRLVMSHLACADDAAEPFNTLQASRFEALAQAYPHVPRALDNSGGAFLGRGHFDLIRAGIALFGGAPNTGPNPMKQVLELDVGITQLRHIEAGAAVGYGCSYICAQTTRIATIPVGYADGWSRQLSNCGSAYVGGIRVPIAGRVSMDSITLDVTSVPEEMLFPGARVELIGPHQSIDDVARDAGTISYEILTQLGHRYVREYSLGRSAPLNRSNQT